MRLTLYGKADCHLCHELKADLLELQKEIGFQLVERNIEESDEEFARFRYLIPVLDIEGGPLLYPPHQRETVFAALVAVRSRNC